MLDPDYALFARIVEAGSLSAAARSTGISPAMASKRLARLERRLGTQLIRRSTRRLELTTVGARFHEDVVQILAAVAAAEARVAARVGEPSGALRIAAPTSFGRLHVAPILAGFLRRFPRVEAELELSDAYTDLLRERIDVAIRITNAPSPGLVTRRLADSRRLLCAAPGYLAGHGEPKTVAELQSHRLLAARGQMPWRLTRGGRAFSVNAASYVATNSSEAVRELALGGVGIALRSLWDVSEDLVAGRLVPVLPACEGAGVGIFAVSMPSPHVPPAAEAFVAALANALAPVPPWERREAVSG